jgi:dihydropteroate synthase
LNIQIINISFPEVFQRYSRKYNIFREFYEYGLSALELRNISFENAGDIQKIILEKKEICYKAKNDSGEFSDLLVLGNLSSFKQLAREILSRGKEDLGYKISSVLRNYSDYDQLSISIGGRDYKLNDNYIIGILNVTPDSFSDGGKYSNPEQAINHVSQMINEGADFIDIGGESSRPGSDPVSSEVELQRVIPIIELIKKQFPKVCLSVDTTKHEVAYEALRRGVSIINDISGGNFDPKILEVTRKYNAAFVVMHLPGTPKDMQLNPHYDDVVTEVYDNLQDKIKTVKKAGIKNILVDPGIGFGKRVRDNFELIKRLDEFKCLGMPVLIGISRKSFLGKALNLQVDERETSTLISETISIKNGARFIRTHNCKNAVQAKQLYKYFTNPDEINV